MERRGERPTEIQTVSAVVGAGAGWESANAGTPRSLLILAPVWRGRPVLVAFSLAADSLPLVLLPATG